MEFTNALELLVKLASFGTAGVSVLAIFFIGRNITTLPNDSPPWKCDLMKKYMNICIVIALICTGSGVANAYFNGEKIKTAEKANDTLGKYTAQLIAERKTYEEIRRDVTDIQQLVDQSGQVSTEVTSKINAATTRLKKLDLPSQQKLLKKVESDLDPKSRIKFNAQVEKIIKPKS